MEEEPIGTTIPQTALIHGVQERLIDRQDTHSMHNDQPSESGQSENTSGRIVKVGQHRFEMIQRRPYPIHE